MSSTPPRSALLALLTALALVLGLGATTVGAANAATAGAPAAAPSAGEARLPSAVRLRHDVAARHLGSRPGARHRQGGEPRLRRPARLRLRPRHGLGRLLERRLGQHHPDQPRQRLVHRLLPPPGSPGRVREGGPPGDRRHPDRAGRKVRRGSTTGPTSTTSSATWRPGRSRTRATAGRSTSAESSTAGPGASGRASRAATAPRRRRPRTSRGTAPTASSASTRRRAAGVRSARPTETCRRAPAACAGPSSTTATRRPAPTTRTSPSRRAARHASTTAGGRAAATSPPHGRTIKAVTWGGECAAAR